MTMGWQKRMFFSILMVLTFWGCAPKVVVQPDVVFPPPPEKPRIKYLYSIYSREDLLKNKKISVRDQLIGKEVRERMHKPYGVAVRSDGLIFVADAGHRCVLVFNENATKRSDALRIIGTGAMGGLIEPINVTLDDQDHLYVTDVQQNIVQQYDRQFQFVKTFGQNKVLERPGGIAFNPKTRELIVVDTKAHNVKCFNQNAELVRTFGERGMGEGQFNFPSNVVCDGDGNIYVVDAMNFRIQIFDSEGKFKSKFGQADNVPGSFTRPRGITLDKEGHVYVSDAAFDNIQIFQKDGTLLLYFGSAGSEPGQFQLPAALCFDDKDRLFVVDQYNKRVQVFQYISYQEK